MRNWLFVITSVLLLIVGGVSAQTEEAAEGQSSPPFEQTPRLRELDFTPFADALAAFTPERAAEIDGIVMGATIPLVQDALAAGTITSEDLTLYFLARIRQYDDVLRTFVELNPNALEEAREADHLRAEGTMLSALHGIPISLKDNIETAAPLHTTAGAAILLDNVPAQDAVIVTQLRDAGVIILGKANLSEFAGAVSTTAGFSAVGGLTGNPFGAAFTAGGSSSGSAASTSAYLTMISVGTETAGSLIAPGAWNGVVTMKPSRDVVSGEGVVPLISYQDSPGPVARSVTDAALLLDVIDSAEVNYAAGLDADALNGVGVGVLRDAILGMETSDLVDASDNPAVLDAIINGLNAAGAVTSDTTVEDLPLFGVFALILDGTYYDMAGYLAAVGAEATTIADLVAYNNADLTTRAPAGQISLEVAVEPQDPKDEYEQAALDLRQTAADNLDAAFANNGVSVLVSLENLHSGLYATAGYPAITVPLGLRQNGMPTGVTFIGRRGEDAQLLAYAYAFEQATKLRATPDLDARVQPSLAQADDALSMDFGDGCQFAGAGEVRDETYDCGSFTVPVNYDQPDGTTIDIRYIRLRASGENPLPDPIVVLAGGPGQSVIISANPGMYGNLREQRDIILAAQRGTQFSGELTILQCLALLQAQNDTAGLEAMANFAAGDFPDVQDLTLDEQLSAYEAWYQQRNEPCYAAFQNGGLDPTQFNTFNSARDLVGLMDSLGYESFNIHAISYGTRYAQEVMRHFPEHLRSVVLDSTVPPNEDRLRTVVRAYNNALLRLFDVCAADATCNEAYPNLFERVQALFDRLDESPLTVDGVTIGTSEVVQQLSNLTGTRANYIPRMIAELEVGDTTTYAALAGSTIGTNDVEARDAAPPALGPITQLLVVEANGDFGRLFELYGEFTQAFLDNAGDVDATRVAAREALSSALPDSPNLPQFLEAVDALTDEDINTLAAHFAAEIEASANTVQEDPAVNEQRAVLVSFGEAPFMYAGTVCYEELPFTSIENALAAYDQLEIPQLGRPTDTVAFDVAVCTGYPMPEPPAFYHEPVTSDVPTLIFQGEFDIATPLANGQLVAQTLENSTLVIVPQQGHEVWKADTCAASIGIAFFTDPTAPVDTSCLAVRQEQFVMPDDPLN